MIPLTEIAAGFSLAKSSEVTRGWIRVLSVPFISSEMWRPKSDESKLQELVLKRLEYIHMYTSL